MKVNSFAPLFNFVSLERNTKRYMLCDWSGGWATPWGLAIEERRLKASHPVITPS